MATSKNVVCGPCDFKHLSPPAVIWCPICNEGMCVDCKDQHSAFSLTRNHEVIEIDHYKKLPDFVVCMEITCNEHDKKLDFYCSTHDHRCCLACIPDKHQECPNVTTMENVVKNVKTSPAFTDARQGWDDLLLNISEIIRIKQKNMESMNQTKIEIETEIKLFRKEINDLLDKFEMQSLHDLNNIFATKRNADQKVLSNLNDKRVEMELFRAHCDTVNAFASDLQAFVAVQHISKKLTAEENKLMSLLQTDALQRNDLKFEKNEIFQSFETKLKNLGTTEVSLSSPYLKLSKRKNDQAQVLPITKEQPAVIHTLKFCLQGSLSIPSEKYSGNITDCTILPDDKCVFVSSKRLITYSPVSKKIVNIPLTVSACSVTSIEHSTVALLVQNENEVQIIELQNSSFRLDNTIKLQERGWSLSCSNGIIAVSVKDVGIQLMNKSGRQFMKIPFNCESYVVVHMTSDKLYYTDMSSHVIHCSSHNGKNIWTHQLSDQRNRYSLTTDNDGQVYVSCQHTNEIILISTDGQTSRTIRTIYSPSALAFNNNRKELLYATSDGKTGFLGLM